MQFEKLTVCKGVCFVCWVLLTSIGGCIIFFPLFFVIYGLKLKQCRWISDTITSTWCVMLVAMFELVRGVKIVVKGDVRQLTKNKSSVIVMNHRTRLDWMFFMAVQARYASLRRFKICLKNELRHLPGIGWAMQVANFMFIKRKWDLDRVIMDDQLKHFAAFNYSPQILLFPEGTDLRWDSLESSHSYARKNELQEFTHVLHPRTTGFTYIVSHMKMNNELDQVVDVTVSYPQNIVQDELTLLTGDIPREIVFTINCYDIAELPAENEPRLARWLEDRWEIKEEYLATVYEKRRHLGDTTGNGYTAGKNMEIERDTTLYMVAGLLFWSLIAVASLCLLILYSYVRWYFFGSIVVYIIISTLIGFDYFFSPKVPF